MRFKLVSFSSVGREYFYVSLFEPIRPAVVDTAAYVTAAACCCCAGTVLLSNLLFIVEYVQDNSMASFVASSPLHF